MAQFTTFPNQPSLPLSRVLLLVVDGYCYFISSSFIAINNKLSKVSSPFLVPVCHPANKSESLAGISQWNDSGLRRATKMKTTSSESEGLKRFQEPCLRRARTGENSNQRPNADQNGISLDRLRILYDMIIFGVSEDDSDVRWIREYKSGAKRFGK